MQSRHRARLLRITTTAGCEVGACSSDPRDLFLLWRRWRRRRVAAEAGLQQVRQGVHVAQLAVLHAEQMGIRCAAAAGAARAKRAVGHHRADHLIHHEMAVGDVDTAWHTARATVGGQSLAGVHAAFNAHAGIAPGHQVDLLFQERVEVGVGRPDQVAARTALLRGDGIPVLRGETAGIRRH